jgi:hypothetical protein
MFVNKAKAGRNQAETEPERIFKLKECCDVLLAAGYFRARIPTLSPFDKVIGGMVWSITASNVDLNVDLLFEENSTIGQRIRLSENIVKALIKMQGPVIQSYQIQGLDYDHIFPVLRWLVRKVIETRALTGDQVRALSVSQFTKSYTAMPSDIKTDSGLAFVASVAGEYKAQRKYRKREAATFESETGQVEATLLEYDERVHNLAAAVDEEQEDRRREREARMRRDGDEGSAEEAAERAAEAEAAARARQEQRLDALQGQLDAHGGHDKVSGSALGHIVSMRAGDIRDAAAAYEAQMARGLGGDAGADGAPVFISVKDQKKQEEQRHKRQTEALRRRATEAEKASDARSSPLDDVTRRLDTVRRALEERRGEVARLEGEIAAIEAVEQASDNKEIIAKLRSLVVLNEALKKQEAEFKASCRAERERLIALIAAVDAAAGDEEAARMAEVERIYRADAGKVTKLRQLLAGKNQEIAKTNRLIDEVPTRAELLQFERRFVELYDMLAERFVELRKYYDMYNTLSTTYEYLQTELAILESINGNFAKGMASKQAQASMLAQFSEMLKSVDTCKEQAQQGLEGVKIKEEVLEEKLAKLVDRQRAYFKAVKEFQEECTLNERLGAAVEQAAKV